LSKLFFGLKKAADIILYLQPLFPISLYFTVLFGNPLLWLSLIIALLPFILRYFYHKVLIKQTPFDIAILIFVIGSIVGYFVAPNKDTAAGALYSLLASILIYYSIVSNQEEGKKYWISFGTVIFFICIGISVWFFSQGTGRLFSFNNWIFEFFRGLPKTDIGAVLHQHAIGALFSVVIPVIFALVLFVTAASRRILLSILCILMMGILFLSVSGNGWIALGIGLAFIFIYWRRWAVFILAPLSAIISALALFFYTDTFWLSNSFSADALLGRFELWEKTVPMLSDWHVFFGIGLGNWPELYYNLYSNTLSEPIAHMHNNYFQIYTDMGIFGILAISLAAIVFVMTAAKVIKSSQNNIQKWLAIGFIGSFLGGAFFNMLDVTLTGTVINDSSYIYLSIPLLWLWAALYAVAYHKLFPHERYKDLLSQCV